MADDITPPGFSAPVDAFEQTDGSYRQKVAIMGAGDNEADVIGSLTETAPASDTASSGLNGRLQRIAQRLSTLIGYFKAEDSAFGDADPGLPLLVKRSDTPAATSGSDGDYEPMQATGGRLNVRGEQRFISAAFSTLTRPANTTAYAANDAVSNNATAGSVTALSATVSDVNDDPIAMARIRIKSTDTGPGSAGIAFRIWLFNSDPTASSGVGGGDNAAWSQKQAGFVGTMKGTFRAASDGSVAVCVPDELPYIICKPVSGAKTLYALVQTLGAFTPSANSTTFDLQVEAFQGRA